MKINLLTCFLAISVFTGCANLGQLLQPETDPAIVRAEDVASRAQASVDRFQKLQQVRPNEDLDARYTAKNLEGFETALDELRRQRETYKVTRSPDAREALRIATEKVDALGGSASRELAGTAINRNRGDTFAPPLSTREDELRMIAVSNSMQIEGLIAKLAELDRKLTLILALQKRDGSGTNSVPPPPVPTNAPAIPPRL